MQILSVRTEGFRNLVPQCVSLKPGINLLLGANGQGKTNFLEAIYLLSTLKSFRLANRRDLLFHQSENLRIEVSLLTRGQEKELSLFWEKSGRLIKVNGHRIDEVLEYLSLLKTVCFSPEDLGILHGSPQIRRRFVDRMIFQMKPAHLLLVRQYNRVLKQRNALFKNTVKIDSAELDVWTERLINLAAQMTWERVQGLKQINERLPEAYACVAGLVHETGLLDGQIFLKRLGTGEEDLDEETLRAYYGEKAQKNAAAERLKGFSQFGCHLEDFNWFYGNYLGSRYASTGQKKTLLLAIRLAELDLLQEHLQEPPVLLLDDLTAELDARRMEALIGYLARRLAKSSAEAQIIITTVSPLEKTLAPLGPLHCLGVNEGLIEPV